MPTDQATIDQIVDKKPSASANVGSSGKKASITSTTSMEKVINSGTVTSPSVSVKTMDGATPAKEAEPGTLKASLAEFPSILNMTEKTLPITTTNANNGSSSNNASLNENIEYSFFQDNSSQEVTGGGATLIQLKQSTATSSVSTFHILEEVAHNSSTESSNLNTSDLSENVSSSMSLNKIKKSNSGSNNNDAWAPTSEWVLSWKPKFPLQTIMRLLQVLVPQVEKICIDKGLTDETEILKFLQNGTLVGLLPVPHPILIRKYQPNVGTIMWFRTYMWGVVYLRFVVHYIVF